MLLVGAGKSTDAVMNNYLLREEIFGIGMAFGMDASEFELGISMAWDQFRFWVLFRDFGRVYIWRFRRSSSRSIFSRLVFETITFVG